MGNALVVDEQGNLQIDEEVVLSRLRTGNFASNGFLKLYPKASLEEREAFRTSLEGLTTEDFSADAVILANGKSAVVVEIDAIQNIIDAAAILLFELDFFWGIYKKFTRVVNIFHVDNQERELFCMVTNSLVIYHGADGIRFNMLGKDSYWVSPITISIDSLVPLDAYGRFVIRVRGKTFIKEIGYGIPFVESVDTPQSIEKGLEKYLKIIGRPRAKDFLFSTGRR